MSVWGWLTSLLDQEDSESGPSRQQSGSRSTACWEWGCAEVAYAYMGFTEAESAGKTAILGRWESIG